MSKIEWTERTWNPIARCSLQSPGCTNCYAMPMARRHELMSAAQGRVSPYAGLTRLVKGKPVWTGELRLVESALTLPLRTARPTTWFVNSMSDLFHDDVPDAWIDRVFAVMALTPRHTYQVLTKRSARMRAWAAADDVHERVWNEAHRLYEAGSGGDRTSFDWPARNVWLGVSAENQGRADERRDDLAALAGAGWTAFVSYEPAIGPIDWRGWEFLAWMISGGENGPRPSHPDWHRAAREYAAAHGIAYFFKQWGSWRAELDRERDDPDWRADYRGQLSDARPGVAWLNLTGGRGFHGERFHVMRRVGKGAAGRLLDGIEHNAMPAVLP